jgi:hypothetical protein
VTSEPIRFDFEDVSVITRSFRRMVRTLAFDLCEIALTTLAQAHAFGKPIQGLPIVVICGFHHAALVCPFLARRCLGRGEQPHEFIRQPRMCLDLSRLQAQHIVGPDVLPYGMAANRTGIELCLRCAEEQGLVPLVYDVDEVFGRHPIE